MIKETIVSDWTDPQTGENKFHVLYVLDGKHIAYVLDDLTRDAISHIRQSATTVLKCSEFEVSNGWIHL